MTTAATKLLGNSKFLCGDEITIYDLVIAGFYVNWVLNPNNGSRGGQYWSKSWSQAPARLKQYIDDFKTEMKEYLDKRAIEHPDCTI